MRQLNRTKVTVRIRKAVFRDEWYLCIESYPVFVSGKSKPQRIVEALNRTITSIIWDKKRTARTTETSKSFKPKRDENGVIMCKTEKDQEACLYADGVRKLRQREYDNADLYSDTEKGIKQTWLAEQLGKSFNMVNAYTRNRRQPPMDVLYKIAEILDVSVKDLLIDNKINK